jgi:hypothetical protein
MRVFGKTVAEAFERAAETAKTAKMAKATKPDYSKSFVA